MSDSQPVATNHPTPRHHTPGRGEGLGGRTSSVLIVQYIVYQEIFFPIPILPTRVRTKKREKQNERKKKTTTGPISITDISLSYKDPYLSALLPNSFTNPRNQRSRRPHLLQSLPFCPLPTSQPPPLRSFCPSLFCRLLLFPLDSISLILLHPYPIEYFLTAHFLLCELCGSGHDDDG